MCGKLEVGCNIREGFQSVVTNQFDELSRRIGEMAVAGLQAVSTFWMEIDSPTLATSYSTPGCTPGPENSCETWVNSGTVGFLHSHVTTVSFSIFTLAIIVAGMRTAWEQRAEPLRDLIRATLVFLAVSAAGTATLQLLVSWSDDFSLKLVRAATPEGQQFQQALGGLVLQSEGTLIGQLLPAMVMMFFGIAVFIVAVIQVVLLLIRSAMLVLLAGTFPLAAAATTTEVGKAWFKRYCAWALA
jgi:type IV secretion system protein TrbL